MNIYSFFPIRASVGTTKFPPPFIHLNLRPLGPHNPSVVAPEGLSPSVESGCLLYSLPLAYRVPLCAAIFSSPTQPIHLAPSTVLLFFIFAFYPSFSTSLPSSSSIFHPLFQGSIFHYFSSSSSSSLVFVTFRVPHRPAAPNQPTNCNSSTKMCPLPPSNTKIRLLVIFGLLLFFWAKIDFLPHLPIGLPTSFFKFLLLIFHPFS